MPWSKTCSHKDLLVGFMDPARMERFAALVREDEIAVFPFCTHRHPLFHLPSAVGFEGLHRHIE